MFSYTIVNYLDQCGVKLTDNMDKCLWNPLKKHFYIDANVLFCFLKIVLDFMF